jgi:hypothetical protein
MEAGLREDSLRVHFAVGSMLVHFDVCADRW